MKKIYLFITALLIFVLSCGNSDKQTNKTEITTDQTDTETLILGKYSHQLRSISDQFYACVKELNPSDDMFQKSYEVCLDSLFVQYKQLLIQIGNDIKQSPSFDSTQSEISKENRMKFLSEWNSGKILTYKSIAPFYFDIQHHRINDSLLTKLNSHIINYEINSPIIDSINMYVNGSSLYIEFGIAQLIGQNYTKRREKDMQSNQGSEDQNVSDRVDQNTDNGSAYEAISPLINHSELNTKFGILSIQQNENLYALNYNDHSILSIPNLTEFVFIDTVTVAEHFIVIMAKTPEGDTSGKRYIFINFHEDGSYVMSPFMGDGMNHKGWKVFYHYLAIHFEINENSEFSDNIVKFNDKYVYDTKNNQLTRLINLYDSVKLNKSSIINAEYIRMDEGDGVYLIFEDSETGEEIALQGKNEFYDFLETIDANIKLTVQLTLEEYLSWSYFGRCFSVSKEIEEIKILNQEKRAE